MCVFRQGLNACMQYFSFDQVNTTKSGMEALRNGYKFSKHLPYIAWQCSVVFKYWVALTPASFIVWTTGISTLFAVYVFVPWWPIYITLHLETFSCKHRISNPYWLLPIPVFPFLIFPIFRCRTLYFWLALYTTYFNISSTHHTSTEYWIIQIVSIRFSVAMNYPLSVVSLSVSWYPLCVTRSIIIKD